MPVNHITLLIHDIVIFEELFSDLKVMSLHFLLGILNGLGHHPMFNGDPFLHAQF